MNDKTLQLVEKLADKLGTTAEHLWGVLVAQAPITAATNLLMFILFGVAITIAARFIHEKLRDAGAFSEWEFAWCGLGLFAIILAICFCFEISMIVAGFFNPEYWALEQVIGK